MKSVFLCIFAIFMICACDDTSFNLKAILENIPQEERADFLKYHLATAYNYIKSGSYVDVRDARSKLSLLIYEYMIENHKIDDEEILKLLREIICFDDGTCVDIGDVGVHPMVKRNN